MAQSRYTHVSVLANDLNESADFYESVFGMERVDTPNFSVPVQWMRCGDLQLHLFKRDITAANYYHFGIHVDDFEEVYQAITEYNIAGFDVVGGTGEEVVEEVPDVYELPDGSVQMYISDPANNLVEVNYPYVEDIDRDIVSKIIDRNERIEQTGEAADAVLYHDPVLEEVGPPRSSSESVEME